MNGTGTKFTLSELLVVRYCKHGYFRWGKILRKCWQDLSRGGNFQRFYFTFFLNKVLWVLFSCGGNFREEGHIAKNPKITPMRKFQRLQYLSFVQVYMYVYIVSSELYLKSNDKSGVETLFESNDTCLR